MSTYTKYCIDVKENLSRLRNPGEDNDGICPQRVIFCNRDNIYYGTFAGTLSVLNDVTINRGLLNDVTLTNPTLCCNEQMFQLTDFVCIDEFLSSQIDKKSQYLGTFDSQGNDSPISGVFQELLGPYETCVRKGMWARTDNNITLSDAYGITRYLGANDYMIVNADGAISDMTLSSIDLICDPIEEVKQVSADLVSLRKEVEQGGNFSKVVSSLYDSLSAIRSYSHIDAGSSLSDVISAVVGIKDTLMSFKNVLSGILNN